ncbi:MAG TPA: HEAT repeat domain-containing protein [Gemmatimonadaceae bacterium]|nr:HEAT repeat domain-containing protein [Gemmatimonadaceae bacterium]
MVPAIVSEIVALPGWNGPMLLLLAKATLILVAALGITIAMQRGSAGARHLVWLATLAIVLLVPAVTAWVPQLPLRILPPAAQPQSGMSATLPAVETETAPATVTNTAPVINAPASIVTEEDGFFARLSGVSLALLLWAAVALGLAAWLAYGAFMVRRIVRNAHPLDTSDWLTPLYEVADRLELEEPPRLLGSNEAKMPFACGFLKPTIVLPSDCDTWSADRRRAVLLHELAHVKRRDLIGHTLGRVACAIYWFHPLVWTAAKQLRNESERACDDLALSCGARASDYAEHLLDIVTSVRRDSTPAVALAMARRKEFEGRMLAILDPELRHSRPSRRQSAALIGSLALIAIVVGAAAPAPRAAEAKMRIATQTPAVDPQFIPQDPATPKHYDRSLDKAIDKSVRKSVDKALDGSLDRDIDKAVDKSLDKSFDKSINTSVQTVTRTSVQTAMNEGMRLGSSMAGKAVGDIIGSVLGGKAAVKNDDRPQLLANVLRTDSDPQLRRTAAWGLSEYADTRIAVEALAEALRKDSDPSVREMAAWALADGDDNSIAVTALSNAIRGDANEKVRATAVWALGNIGDHDSYDALVAVLNDKSKNIRMRAAWAIGNIEPREAPKALVAMLRDADPEVRELTAWALYQIEDAGTVPALNDALKAEGNKELQLAYIRALAAMGEKSLDAIRGLLTSSDPKIKSMAVRALAGGNAAGPWPWPWPEPRPYP